MSIVYRIDRDKGITCVVWHGLITPTMMLDQARRLIADPDWPPPGRLHLVDLQTAGLNQTITDDVLKQAAEIYGADRTRLINLRQAIVANDAFAKSRLFETFLPPGPTVIVFNNIMTACIWLGVDIEETRRTLDELRAEAERLNQG